MPFSVLLVDDQASILEMLRTLINLDERLRIFGTAGDGKQAVDAIRAEGCPDAVVCDVEMPRMSGLEALPLLRRACPDTVIVMYTSDPTSSDAAYQLGADEVVDKTEDPSGLIDLLVEACVARRDHGPG